MILDTNGLSAMADGTPGLKRLLAAATELAIPVVVLGEFRYGIAQSRLARQYEEWLACLVKTCQILPLDENTASHYATIRGELKRIGKPIPANDVWIAALARQHGLAIISRDEHFDVVPKLERFDW